MPLNPATEKTLQHFVGFINHYPHEDMADVGGAGYEEHIEQFGVKAKVYDLRDGFDITKTPLPRKHQTIISLNTFEHILDPMAAAKNIIKSLKPGGYIFISTVWKYDYHAYTTDDGFYVPDYYRFTDEVLKAMFSELEIDRCWLEQEGLRDFERVSLIAHKKDGK